MLLIHDLEGQQYAGNPLPLLDTSFHERRKAERMKDPEFRSAYEESPLPMLESEPVVPCHECPECGLSCPADPEADLLYYCPRCGVSF